MTNKKLLINSKYGKLTFRITAAHHWNSFASDFKLSNEKRFGKRLKEFLTSSLKEFFSRDDAIPGFCLRARQQFLKTCQLDLFQNVEWFF